ncbi:peptidylprolyl isomerase [Nitrospina gracilis]|uniref:peptidylprolyl isomerase n=1 Tax=Nitrospina gracilis TaxID=35801 RepID=UPI001F2FE4F1|nr:peptidyl-prolyl cis-trans isomerase [Nitrospina gracilis]MCF8721479.1 hypothetical protein [Nitrospina gracilis Nb-211]
MVGFSHQIQVRHIVVDKPEVAELLKSTINEVKTATGRVKMLMRLAEKYSLCPSKEDGGNLGWIVLAEDDPRKKAPDPVLENRELEDLIRDAVKKMLINRGELYGPVETKQGHHLLIISNEFGAERSTEFTGSAL